MSFSIMSFAFLSTPVHPLSIHAHSQSFKSQQRISRQRDGGIGSTYALNRILFDRHEQSSDGSVSLLPSDPRAIHVRNVLNLSSSNPLVRAAIVDELLLDQVPVSFSKYDDGSVTFLLQHAATTLSPPPIPPVTLVLAVPRPKVLARLIPQIAAMGVAHLVLVNAYKVCDPRPKLILLYIRNTTSSSSESSTSLTLLSFLFLPLSHIFSLLCRKTQNQQTTNHLHRLSAVTLTLRCSATRKKCERYYLTEYHKQGLIVDCP